MTEGFPTLTRTLSEILPQEFVTIKVKVVVECGDATGIAQLIQLNTLSGDQVYDPFPVPLSVVEEPAQIETSAPALTKGRGLTTMSIDEDAEHKLASVTITVYVAPEVKVA